MGRFFRRLGQIIESKYLIVIVIAALLLGGAFYGATRIRLESGMGTILPADNQVMIDYERFSEDFGGESIIILVTADTLDELLANENLVAMDAIEADVNSNADLEGVSALSPALLFKQANAGSLPATPDAAKAIMAIPLLAEQFSQMIFDNTSPPVRSEKAHAFVVVSAKGNLMSDNLEPVTNAVTDAVDAVTFNENIEVTVTGGPMIMQEVQGMMIGTMSVMMGLAVALLFLIIALIFKVRGFFAWRWLPLGVVVIGTIYTFGVMGYLSVPLTMVSMAVFPVLLGLGIDYGIQVHNRYNEEGTNKSAAKAIIETITSMGPVVGIALIASCLGLCGMFFSPVPMVRDFSLMLIIGMLCSYVVAIFPLPVILYWQHRREDNNGNGNNNGDKVAKKIEEREDERGFLERGLHRIAPWVIKSPKIILPIALILTVCGVVADFYIDIEFDETKWVSENSPVMQKVRKLSEVSEGLATFNVLVEGEDLADPTTLEWMADLKQEVIADRDAEVADVKYISDFNTIADTVMQANGGTIPDTAAGIKAVLDAIPDAQKNNLVLMNDANKYPRANIIITATEWDIDVVQGIRDRMAEYLTDTPEGVDTAVTGGLILQSEVKNAMTSSRSKITLISIGFILAGLFLMFKFDLIKAIIATLPVVLIIGWSALVMFALGMKYTPLTAALGALVIAIGVEFTILLMSRYYEERGKGEAPILAMTTAMTRIGRAIAASALTTIGGFAALLFAFDFTILQDFGIITMINVFFALAVTILVLPSLMVIVDRWRERRKQSRIE